MIEELKFLGKFTTKKIGGWGREGSGWGVGLVGSQGGCERKIEVFGKIHTKKSGGWGIRRGWDQVGVGLVGCRVGGGWVRVDVNAMLGVGGDVGYGGCEPRIEGIVQCTKRYCTISRK